MATSVSATLSSSPGWVDALHRLLVDQLTCYLRSFEHAAELGEKVGTLWRRPSQHARRACSTASASERLI